MKTRYALNKHKYLLDEEVHELERRIDQFYDQNPRDCTLLATLLHTGARASEALAIKAKDVSSGVVLIRGLKGSDDREIPIPSWLFDRLKRLTPSRDGRLFPIKYDRLHDIWWLYRPVEKKLHALRHTFAIRQLRKHGRLDVIKKLLGHRKIENTMVYSDYAYTQDEFRRLVL